jgi:hypothetical protein
MFPWTSELNRLVLVFNLGVLGVLFALVLPIILAALFY